MLTFAALVYPKSAATREVGQIATPVVPLSGKGVFHPISLSDPDRQVPFVPYSGSSKDLCAHCVQRIVGAAIIVRIAESAVSRRLGCEDA